MVHAHGESHLVRRQRFRDDNQVQTVVSVRVITMPNTFTVPVIFVTQSQDGPKTLVAPVERPRPSTTADSNRVTTSAKRPSATPSAQNNNEEESSTSFREANTLLVATRTPTPSAVATAAVSAATATSSVAAASSADSAQGGMSTGAKAGLALGILLAVGALLIGLLFLYRRKKKQMAPTKDNEKYDLHLNDAPPPPPPQVQAAPVPAPSIRTERTLSTAPRLSLRPVTQFDPSFDKRKSEAGQLAAASLAPPLPSKDREQPSSAWERPGAAGAPVNPFNDPEHAQSPAANPFGNNAAIDANQSRIPDSPPNASPMHSTQPSADLSKAAPASNADIDPVAAATALASLPMDPNSSLPVDNFPHPPNSKGQDGAPTSPAWTDDLPASPGPAPMGPPPPVGAVVGFNAQGGSPPPNNVHRIQLDFKPSMQDELELRAGQLVRMLHEYDDGWALCIRMDRSQQGVVPRTCLSKHPVKPRTGPPRQVPPPAGMRGPPMRPNMGHNGVPQPRPLSPASGRGSPHPPSLSPANGRMSPSPRAMSPGPRNMSPAPRGMSPGPRGMSPGPRGGPRNRSNSNAPQYGPAPPPAMGRPRSNSASQAGAPRRGPAPGLSPMNPNSNPPMQPPAQSNGIPARKPVPGMAM